MVRASVIKALTPTHCRLPILTMALSMVPLLFVSYMFQYLDKSAMSNTAILGLRTDLHLIGQEYSWASSVFNFGYLAASLPVALIMVRFPIGKFMAVSMCACPLPPCSFAGLINLTTAECCGPFFDVHGGYNERQWPHSEPLFPRLHGGGGRARLQHHHFNVV